MKKFYILMLASVMSLGAGALELTFWNGNEKIAPGSTVEFNDVKVENLDTYKEVTMKPDLYISSSIYTSNLRIKATCTSGQSIQMCAGGRCQGGESVTKEKVTVATNTKLPLVFDYVGELDLDEAVPEVTTLLEAEDTTEPDSKVEFILVMSEKGASLSRVETASNSLRAVAGGIRYNVEGSATLNVYTTDGALAASVTATGEGSVALPAGLYIARLGTETVKLLVE